MASVDPQPRPGRVASRGPVQYGGVFLALLLLTVAGFGFSGNALWLFTSAAKWVFAGIIAVIGLGMIVSALPARRRGRT